MFDLKSNFFEKSWPFGNLFFFLLILVENEFPKELLGDYK